MGQPENPKDPKDNALELLVSDEGALLVGPESALAQLSDTESAAAPRAVSPTALRRASQALGSAAKARAESGRWLKLDAESADYLKRLGVKPGEIRSGVVRVKDLPRGTTLPHRGSVLKHLSFEKAGLLTPAAPMLAASALQQAAVEKQMAQMQDYLERIDEKLDKVLRFQQDSLAGDIDGVAEALAEAHLVLEGTGTVTDTQWSTVQGLATEVAKLQGRVLRYLGAVADTLARSKTSPGKVKETFQKANSEAQFWVYQLARTVQLQNQMYVLQLGRVDAVEGEVAGAFAEAVAVARDKRAQRLTASLSTIADNAHDLGSFSTLRRAVDWNSPRAVEEVNRFFAQLRAWTHAADLPLEGIEDLAPVRPVEAARELTATAREAASAAQQRAAAAGDSVTHRTRQAWGATRGALEGAARGAIEGASKGAADAGPHSTEER